jgi:hypothetical protein
MLRSMLRNLRCWIFSCRPSFPLWLLSGDRVEVDGRQFVYRGWPKRFPDEAAFRDYFSDGRRSDAKVAASSRETLTSR